MALIKGLLLQWGDTKEKFHISCDNVAMTAHYNAHIIKKSLKWSRRLASIYFVNYIDITSAKPLQMSNFCQYIFMAKCFSSSLSYWFHLQPIGNFLILSFFNNVFHGILLYFNLLCGSLKNKLNEMYLINIRLYT